MNSSFDDINTEDLTDDVTFIHFATSQPTVLSKKYAFNPQYTYFKAVTNYMISKGSEDSNTDILPVLSFSELDLPLVYSPAESGYDSVELEQVIIACLLYTSPSPRD